MSPKPKARDFTIDRFNSGGQQLYKLLGIKESFNMWKEFNCTEFFLYTNMTANLLFCTEIWPPWRHVKTIYRVMHRVFTNWLTGSPGDVVLNKVLSAWGGSATRSNPVAFFKPFMTNPFPTPSNDKWYLFHIPTRKQRIPFCCNWSVFLIWINS